MFPRHVPAPCFRALFPAPCFRPLAQTRPRGRNRNKKAAAALPVWTFPHPQAPLPPAGAAMSMSPKSISPKSMSPKIVTVGTGSTPTQDDPQLILRLGSYAAVGLFALALLAALQFAAEIMTPIISALVVGAILARISDRMVRWGMTPFFAIASVIGLALAAGMLMINALVEPLSALSAQAPVLAEAVNQLVAPLLRPLTGLRNALMHAQGAAAAPSAAGGEAEWLVSFIGRLTPALGQLLVFFASLGFFLSGRAALRRQFILAMPERASRLMAIRAIGAVEEALALYFGTTTLVYAAVGVLTALVAWAFGFANPLLWGVMTFASGYIPYLGPGLIALSLAAYGFLAHPHALLALAPAATYLAIHVSRETFVIPTLLGRRYEVNPFLIFLSIVFWSWMWGPVGAVLAAPLLLSVTTLIDLLTQPQGSLP
jgi:predicted PurR-regulated permease PerM